MSSRFELPNRDRLLVLYRRRVQFLRILWEQIHHDKVPIRASGLSFSTLLATVPLVAVLFALFSAFAAFDDLTMRVRDLLFAQVLPTRQDEIIDYIDHFTANTSKLGFIGFAFLIVTSILLLDSIEKSFNEIWHVQSSRRLINKITAYTSVLVFGAVFIGASVSVSARIKAVLLTGGAIDAGLVSQIGTWLFPLLFSFVAFLIMYLVIPHARVRWPSALGGAFVAAVLWEVAKAVFALSVGQSVQYSTIYGSLAVVPIFLVWLYITWIIILVGLEIAHTHQFFAVLLRRRDRQLPNPGQRVLLGLRLFVSIADRFHRGQRAPSPVDLADQLRARVSVVEEAIDLMVAGELVRCLTDETNGGGLVPARSLDRITVSELIQAIFPVAPHGSNDDAALDSEVGSLLRQFQGAGHEALGSTTVRDLLDRVEPD